MPPQTAPLSQHLPQRLPDLHAARLAVQQGHTSFTELMEQSITAAQAPACAHVFSRTDFVTARQRAQQADAEQLAQPAFFSAASRQPLAGLAVSIKDLFDIADQPTPAGSLALADAPAATQDAAAVARLRSAGAAWVGRTNMVEFAFSGVGVNPHFGTPTAWDARTGAVAGGDPATPRVPGGSSSGAGVSVATGAAFVGLGSDTGGSIRIPAALNGIVGFKSTARLVPTRGAVPLSTTLDTACAMTRSVRDAMLVHEVLAARSVVRSTAPLSSYRLAVARTTFLDGLDATVATAFERSLRALRAAGAQIEEIALPQTAELTTMQAQAGFSPAESYTWHRPLLARAAAQYDPRVRARIERGAGMLAADYVELVRARADWIARMEQALAGFDAVLSPTVPITAPPIASVAPGVERDDEFFRVNGLLLRNPSAINMLDGCALSLPCHTPGELPVGLMVWHGALHDDTVLNIGLQIEHMLLNL
jgi:amidase/aspartyl-tRNA(Asn)/glutamyl-tRNA(Gln) amidotransferase subunit A